MNQVDIFTHSTGISEKLVENCGYFLVPAACMDLPGNATAGFFQLKRAMFPICSVHNVDFFMLVEERKFGYGESISVFVDFVLTDPPYMRCRYGTTRI